MLNEAIGAFQIRIIARAVTDLWTAEFSRNVAMSQICEIVRRPHETETAVGPTENLNRLIQREAARTGGATAGIARNVELYNLAFKLAWKHIPEDHKLQKPHIARQLHDSIRRELREGATEAVLIASEALKDSGY